MVDWENIYAAIRNITYLVLRDILFQIRRLLSSSSLSWLSSSSSSSSSLSSSLSSLSSSPSSSSSVTTTTTWPMSDATLYVARLTFSSYKFRLVYTALRSKLGVKHLFKTIYAPKKWLADFITWLSPVEVWNHLRIRRGRAQLESIKHWKVCQDAMCYFLWLFVFLSCLLKNLLTEYKVIHSPASLLGYKQTEIYNK